MQAELGREEIRETEKKKSEEMINLYCNSAMLLLLHVLDESRHLYALVSACLVAQILEFGLLKHFRFYLVISIQL